MSVTINHPFSMRNLNRVASLSAQYSYTSHAHTLTRADCKSAPCNAHAHYDSELSPTGRINEVFDRGDGRLSTKYMEIMCTSSCLSHRIDNRTLLLIAYVSQRVIFLFPGLFYRFLSSCLLLVIFAMGWRDLYARVPISRWILYEIITADELQWHVQSCARII